MDKYEAPERRQRITMKTPMDVAALLGAVQREFKNEDRDGTRVGVVVATRVYPAAPKRCGTH